MRKFDAKKLDELLSDETINVSAIARKAGVTPGALQQIRKGITTPKANTLVAIADILRVPMEYFFVNDYQYPDSELKEAM